VGSSARLGIALRRGPVDQLRLQARAARTGGMDTLWIADHMTGFPVDQPVFDPFSALGALSVDAEGLSLGLAVTDPFRRHPAVLAQIAMTVRAFSGTPLYLGLGAGESMNLDPYGIPRPRPLAHLRETITALKALERSHRDAPVDLDTGDLHFEAAYLQQPETLPELAVFLGTNGPKGRRLVGELADGWLPIMLTPELVAEDLAGIRAAAERAGRDPGAIRVAYHSWFGVADSSEAGLGMIASAIPETFDWDGLRVLGSVADDIRRTADELPDELVRRVAVYGTPEDCAAMIAEYAEAGVTDMIFRHVNPLDELADVLRAVRDAVG
jgi:phthiodiolone/phenolphthiodiolone dimycocerosates ketoreductase